FTTSLLQEQLNTIRQLAEGLVERWLFIRRVPRQICLRYVICVEETRRIRIKNQFPATKLAAMTEIYDQLLQPLFQLSQTFHIMNRSKHINIRHGRLHTGNFGTIKFKTGEGIQPNYFFGFSLDKFHALL